MDKIVFSIDSNENLKIKTFSLKEFFNTRLEKNVDWERECKVRSYDPNFKKDYSDLLEKKITIVRARMLFYLLISLLIFIVGTILLILPLIFSSLGITMPVNSLVQFMSGIVLLNVGWIGAVVLYFARKNSLNKVVKATKVEIAEKIRVEKLNYEENLKKHKEFEELRIEKIHNFLIGEKKELFEFIKNFLQAFVLPVNLEVIVFNKVNNLLEVYCNFPGQKTLKLKNNLEENRKFAEFVLYFALKITNDLFHFIPSLIINEILLKIILKDESKVLYYSKLQREDFFSLKLDGENLIEKLDTQKFVFALDDKEELVDISDLITRKKSSDKVEVDQIEEELKQVSINNNLKIEAANQKSIFMFYTK